MRGRDRAWLLQRWWLLVLVASVVAAAWMHADSRAQRPDVIRVVGYGSELWAATHEGGFLQGGEHTWWVSRDGGDTWREEYPPFLVEEADPEVQACTDIACYRLVDGLRVERRAADGATWQREHERPPEEAQPPNDQWRHDWDEARSIAAAEGPGIDAAVVAAGKEGALVRTADGTWRQVWVGRTWDDRLAWWLAAASVTVVLFVGLVGDLVLRSRRPTPIADPPWPQPGAWRI